jgi:O-antigen/teichoic acid export membrane protein
MKQVARVFAAKAVDYALKFVVSVIIARYLGPSDKGVLTFAMLVVTWTATFGNFSLTDATVYLLGKRAFSTAQALTSLLGFSILAGGLYVLALFGLIAAAVVRWPVGEPALFFLLLSLVPLNLLLNNFTGILQGLSLFKAYNFFAVFRSAAFLLAILIAVGLAPNALEGVALAMIGAAAFAAAVMLFYIARVANWRFQLSLQFLKNALHYGLRNHISVILATIAMRFDQFVLGAMLTPVHLGWYSTAVTISEVPHLLSDAVGTVLFPRVAGDPKGAGSFTARACRITAAVMLLGAAALVALAVPLVLIFGEPFLPSVKPLYILAPGIVFLSISKVLTKYLCGIGRPQLCIWSTAAAAAVTLIMIVPMVKRYGMLGAAATSTTAYALGAAVDLFLTMRLSTLSATAFLFPKKTDFQLTALQ